MHVNDVIDKYKHLSIAPDWNTKKLQVMKMTLMAKFEQNADLKKLLLSTGNSVLVEDSPKDYFWGVGKNKTGQNMLGKLLMEVKSEL